VQVIVGSGSCDRLDRIDVSETPTDVTLTAVVVETEPGSGLFGVACTADLESEFVNVDLDAPLAARTLLGCDPQGRFSGSASEDGSGPSDCQTIAK
jgi:hypothetical protein